MNVETRSRVSANRQAFAMGDFIQPSCLPRRETASLQLTSPHLPPLEGTRDACQCLPADGLGLETRVKTFPQTVWGKKRVSKPSRRQFGARNTRQCLPADSLKQETRVNPFPQTDWGWKRTSKPSRRQFEARNTRQSLPADSLGQETRVKTFPQTGLGQETRVKTFPQTV